MFISAIILAAGKGTRMKSDLPKVLHEVAGTPLAGHVLQALSPLVTHMPCMVVGHGAPAVEERFAGKADFCLQAEQKGTGHAVLCARDIFAGKGGYVLVAAGDMPLLTTASLRALLEECQQKRLAACVLTAEMENPFGYGRIVRDEKGNFSAIKEQRDLAPGEESIREVNTSVYCFETEALFAALGKITPNNAQGEYYLTDVLPLLAKDRPVGTATCTATEAMGINDRAQLAEAETEMRRIIARRHMLAGVTLIDPAATYIGADVTIGANTVIHPGNHLLGQTVIGENCTLLPGNRLENARLGDGVTVAASTLLACTVGSKTTVGPNAYLRPGAEIGQKCRIGDFVEIKNARIGDESKVSHLAYVGDAEVGKRCNIGCGVVFVNYDGKNKFRTVLEDDVFVGSNSNLVAPLHLSQFAYVAAGSTITKNVPGNALAVARARQENKEDYAARIRARWQS